MTREEALKILKENLKSKNLVKHSLAVEAVMRALAKRLGEDEEAWGLAGLLHDIDYEETANTPEEHGKVGAKKLEKMGFPPPIVHAILAHNELTGVARETAIDRALFAADPLTGLIVAAALIHPHKKLQSIDTPFVLRRFEEKSFARGAKRENIETCRTLGLSLEEFVEIGLKAMQEISQELGL